MSLTLQYIYNSSKSRCDTFPLYHFEMLVRFWNTLSLSLECGTMCTMSPNTQSRTRSYSHAESHISTPCPTPHYSRSSSWPPPSLRRWMCATFECRVRNAAQHSVQNSRKHIEPERVIDTHTHIPTVTVYNIFIKRYQEFRAPSFSRAYIIKGKIVVIFLEIIYRSTSTHRM